MRSIWGKKITKTEIKATMMKTATKYIDFNFFFLLLIIRNDNAETEKKCDWFCRMNWILFLLSIIFHTIMMLYWLLIFCHFGFSMIKLLSLTIQIIGARFNFIYIIFFRIVTFPWRLLPTAHPIKKIRSFFRHSFRFYFFSLTNVFPIFFVCSRSSDESLSIVTVVQIMQTFPPIMVVIRFPSFIVQHILRNIFYK